MKERNRNPPAATTSYMICAETIIHQGLYCGAAIGLEGIPTHYTPSAP